MSRQKTEINPERADRVKILLQREHITQSQLAERICQTQQNLSRIIQKKQPLTEATAQTIVKAFPEYRIEWVMGYDDIMTVDRYKCHTESEQTSHRFIDLDDAVEEQERIMQKCRNGSEIDPDRHIRYAMARSMKVWLLQQYSKQTGTPFHGYWIRYDGETICSVCWLPKSVCDWNGTCVGCGAKIDGVGGEA